MLYETRDPRAVKAFLGPLDWAKARIQELRMTATPTLERAECHLGTGQLLSITREGLDFVYRIRGTCGTCSAYQASQHEKGAGTCRDRPPAPVTLWPKTFSSDWCAQWDSRALPVPVAPEALSLTRTSKALETCMAAGGEITVEHQPLIELCRELEARLNALGELPPGVD